MSKLTRWKAFGNAACLPGLPVQSKGQKMGHKCRIRIINIGTKGQSMPRSSTEIILHFVWATKKREPILTPQWEPMVYRCVQSECRELGGVVLALGGMPDHVHLLAVVPGHISASKMMQQVKGVSARFANGELPLTAFLKWQEGYNASSVSELAISLPSILYPLQKTAPCGQYPEN